MIGLLLSIILIGLERSDIIVVDELMKFLYGIKGCSKCDLREGCMDKNSKDNLLESIKVHYSLFSFKTWESMCRDFVKVG